MAEYPALPLWTDAYLGDTHHLTTIEHGAYLLLLIAAWRTKECGLPDDDRKLAKFAHLTARQWSRMRPALEGFYRIEDGMWWNDRLLDERDAVRRLTMQRSDAGKASALKRKHRGATSVGTKSQRNGNTHTHTQETTNSASGAYAFQGRVIRLNRRDYDGWRKRFSALPDLDAELATRDDWLAEQPYHVRKNWFHSTPQHLLNKHNAAIERRDANGHSFTPQPSESEAWAIRLHDWQENGFWTPANWGPPPDHPDCQAPKEMLAKLETADEPT